MIFFVEAHPHDRIPPVLLNARTRAQIATFCYAKAATLKWHVWDKARRSVRLSHTLHRTRKKTFEIISPPIIITKSSILELEPSLLWKILWCAVDFHLMYGLALALWTFWRLNFHELAHSTNKSLILLSDRTRNTNAIEISKKPKIILDLNFLLFFLKCIASCK